MCFRSQTNTKRSLADTEGVRTTVTQYLKASSDDKQEIIDLIDYVFSHEYTPHDFKKMLPKVYFNLFKQWKIEQKAEKFLELAAKSLDKDLDTAYDEVGYELMDIFGDIYGAFESSAEEGAETLTEEGISQEWADAITEVAVKNIQPPEVHISGYVDIKNYNPDGVDVIREALMAAEAENIEVQCVGAPRYRITVTSTDYLVAEKQLKEAAEKAIAIVEEADGTGEFLREIEN